MDNRGNLQISVTNFGPIESAEIDLRPLTVFVGPSNTGKSYLAILIYALHEFFSNTIGFVSGRSRYRRMRDVDLWVRQNVSEEHISETIDWIDLIIQQMETFKALDSLSVPVPDSIRPLIQSVMEDLREPGVYLGQELSRCFGVEDAETLIRYGIGDETEISLRRLNSEDHTGIEYGATIDHEDVDLSVSGPKVTPLYAEYTYPDEFEELLMEFVDFRSKLDKRMDGDFKLAFALFMEFVAQLIEGNALSPLNRKAHYLPADRTGVMHAHRLAVGSLIARAPYAGLQRDDPLPVLSGVLADFLQQLTELGEPRLSPRGRMRRSRVRQSDGASYLAKMLEKEILGGAVNIHPSPTGYPSFYYQPDGWGRELPLMNASSMVSEIAPVALYLRHVVGQGDVLIIEEPESHLHPALQIEFIRRLAAVVNSGVRVMITTHSEWVLNELTNLVRLSELAPEDRDGIGGADYALSPEQLGVWLFKQNGEKQGSVVKEIPFDEEFGGFQTGYDEVALDNYNDYIRIGRRLGQEGSD